MLKKNAVIRGNLFLKTRKDHKNVKNMAEKILIIPLLVT